MKLYQVDDAGALSHLALRSWIGRRSRSYGIDTVIDLEGGLDHCIPTVPDQILYVYFPIYDEALPNLAEAGGGRPTWRLA